MIQRLFRLINTLSKKHLSESEQQVLRIYHTRYKQYKAIKRTRNKAKIKAAFFVIHESVWKYDYLYHLLVNDSRFEPIIIICPDMMYGEEMMVTTMNKAYNHFWLKKYNVIKTRNENGEWLNVKTTISPDLIFFTNPWEITRPEYYITSFTDSLTCYVPYFFVMNSLNEHNYNSLFHNLVWKAFYETDIHYRLAKKHSDIRARNVIVSGYPGLDPFIQQDRPRKSTWKNIGLKKIIIAPHHTIEGQDAGLTYSNFLTYAGYFKELAEKYKNDIQFAFKPHPLLKSKLYLNENWGKDATDAYYHFWETRDNCILCEADYIDLFIESDGIIHDSGSFITEYLMVDKPALYLFHDDQVTQRMNEFGQISIETHYKAYTQKDIAAFIEDIILSEMDDMSAVRKKFLDEHIIQSKGKVASAFIFQYIKTTLS